jgi:hypothetical protein
MVMPMFLLLAMLILVLVRTSVTMMALQSAVSQTVRTAAPAWYAISLLHKDDGPRQSEDRTRHNAGMASLDGAREILGEYGRWLPSPLREWSDMLAGGQWSPEAEAAKLMFGELTDELADSKVLKKERLSIVSVELPKAGDPSEAYLSLTAEYRLPLRDPFTGHSLSVRASARERAWVGGSPSRARENEETDNRMRIEFVSLDPDPVRPGRKATLVLRTEPGAVLDLSVYYKSGRSQAKHLGTAKSDESGIVSWTWHVSGNTTSGEWSWEAVGEGGRLSRTFRVARLNE